MKQDDIQGHRVEMHAIVDYLHGWLRDYGRDVFATRKVFVEDLRKAAARINKLADIIEAKP